MSLNETITKSTIANQVELKNGAKILLECLHAEGVDKIFGYPGGIVLGIYDELYKCNSIKHYLVRHEQAAIHAAEGYARVTGKVGVAITTSGPGATNTVTGIVNAYLDGYPLVVITGQVSTSLIGKDAFQEANISSITRSCTKQNYLVENLKDLPRIVKEAFYIAKTGKPGPVVIDLPKDIIIQQMKFVSAEKSINIANADIDELTNVKIEQALSLLYKAERPIIISGGGVISSNASDEIAKIAHILNIPVANTLMGTGSFPAKDDLAIGLLGMNGNSWTNYAVSNCDVLFAVGTRFNDKVTGNIQTFCPKAKIIHIDIDKENLNKNVKADIVISGDAKSILSKMLMSVDINYNNDTGNKWLNDINSQKRNCDNTEIKTKKMSSKRLIRKISECMENINPIVCTEVGQHQIWTARSYKFNEPRKFITSGGLGTMGFGFPAAIGAAIAKPNDIIINIAGDGSIQMNIQELMTCVDYNLNVKVFIINNGYLGMVRQMQEVSCDKRYSETQITSPDYVKLAEAYGALGIRVKKEADIEKAIKKAIKHQGPVLIDFIVEPFEIL